MTLLQTLTVLTLFVIVAAGIIETRRCVDRPDDDGPCLD